MAYMNQEKKKVIAEKLKTVVPKKYKYTLGVRNHSTIVCTIKSGPVPELIGLAKQNFERNNYLDINPYYLDTQLAGEALELVQKIKDVLNTDNYDNSDIMTDYFDVGHYIDINFGRWDKPYQVAA